MKADSCSQCLLPPDVDCIEVDCPRRQGPQVGESWVNGMGRQVKVVRIEGDRVAFTDVHGEGSGFMLGIFFKQQFKREVSKV